MWALGLFQKFFRAESASKFGSAFAENQVDALFKCIEAPRPRPDASDRYCVPDAKRESGCLFASGTSIYEVPRCARSGLFFAALFTFLKCRPGRRTFNRTSRCAGILAWLRRGAKQRRKLYSFYREPLAKLLRGRPAVLPLARKLNVLKCTPRFLARLRLAFQSHRNVLQEALE